MDKARDRKRKDNTATTAPVGQEARDRRNGPDRPAEEIEGWPTPVKVIRELRGRDFEGDPDDEAKAVADLKEARRVPRLAISCLLEEYRDSEGERAIAEARANDYREIYQTIKSAFERVSVKLKTKEGESKRAEIWGMVQDHFDPLRDFLHNAPPMNGDDADFWESVGVKVCDGRLVPAIHAKVKPGHPVAVNLEETLRYATGILKWTWKECAAAVFLSGCWRLKYKFAVKSFGDEERRRNKRSKRSKRNKRNK